MTSLFFDKGRSGFGRRWLGAAPFRWWKQRLVTWLIATGGAKMGCGVMLPPVIFKRWPDSPTTAGSGPRYSVLFADYASGAGPLLRNVRRLCERSEPN